MMKQQLFPRTQSSHIGICLAIFDAISCFPLHSDEDVDSLKRLCFCLHDFLIVATTFGASEIQLSLSLTYRGLDEVLERIRLFFVCLIFLIVAVIFVASEFKFCFLLRIQDF